MNALSPLRHHGDITSVRLWQLSSRLIEKYSVADIKTDKTGEEFVTCEQKNKSL
jgi:hypothetical protein